MPVGRIGRSCVRGCGRPAREAGGYSTACFKALTPMERKVEFDCAAETSSSASLAVLSRIWRAS